jgi:NMD protein affecting ribosome stability and mRNA decay
MSSYIGCVKSNDGKVYCYDKDLKSWVVLDVTPINMSLLPKDVIEAYLMKAVNEEPA